MKQGENIYYSFKQNLDRYKIYITRVDMRYTYVIQKQIIIYK